MLRILRRDMVVPFLVSLGAPGESTRPTLRQNRVRCRMQPMLGGPLWLVLVPLRGLEVVALPPCHRLEHGMSRATRAVQRIRVIPVC